MGNDTKPWWASRTVLVGLIGTLFAIASAIGFLPEGITQDMVLEAVLAVTGILAVVFRVKATKEVG